MATSGTSLLTEFQPAFTVTGPNGYYRESQLGFALDADRQLVLPFDGEYDVTVLPSVVLQGASEPIGDANATYAAIIEVQAWPVATALAVPVSGELVQSAGSLLNLDDNFFQLSADATTPRRCALVAVCA